MASFGLRVAKVVQKEAARLGLNPEGQDSLKKEVFLKGIFDARLALTLRQQGKHKEPCEALLSAARDFEFYERYLATVEYRPLRSRSRTYPRDIPPPDDEERSGCYAMEGGEDSDLEGDLACHLAAGPKADGGMEDIVAELSRTVTALAQQMKDAQVEAAALSRK